MMWTGIYPMLDALNDGRFIRRAAIVGLHLCAWLTLAVGAVGVIAVLKLAFSASVPIEATVGGIAWALIFAVVIVAIGQVFRYHVKDVEQLADGRFIVIPVVSILLRIVGELFAVWCAGFGFGGFLLVLVAGRYAAMLTSSVDIIPGLPSVAATGLLGAVWILVMSGVTGVVGLLVFYLWAEGINAVADIANQVRRLVSLQSGQQAASAPVAGGDGPAAVVVVHTRACGACGAVSAMDGARFCEDCGARL